MCWWISLADNGFKVLTLGNYIKKNVSVQKVMGKKGKSDREKLTCVRWMISYAK
jgi:hypothetical protein